MKIAAVLLAAGASRRLGHPKQLLQLDGEALVRRAARLALEAGFQPVLVVLGAHASVISPSLEGLAVTLLQNGGWEEGLASSIRVGVAALPGDAAGAAFLVCDQPALDLDLLLDLRRRFVEDPSRPAACAYGGSAGIPAVFPRADFATLSSLQGDTGAKALLGGATRIPFPGGAADLDRPEDVEQNLRR